MGIGFPTRARPQGKKDPLPVLAFPTPPALKAAFHPEPIRPRVRITGPLTQPGPGISELPGPLAWDCCSAFLLTRLPLKLPWEALRIPTSHELMTFWPLIFVELSQGRCSGKSDLLSTVRGSIYGPWVSHGVPWHCVLSTDMAPSTQATTIAALNIGMKAVISDLLLPSKLLDLLSPCSIEQCFQVEKPRGCWGSSHLWGTLPV